MENEAFSVLEQGDMWYIPLAACPRAYNMLIFQLVRFSTVKKNIYIMFDEQKNSWHVSVDNL